ncbi:MAG: hypothetical protein H6625_07005 [Bdellovibrionaceae bacterium]|nr:hypothetical protein [Pseudobdellovibrionaceae bacterium]
MFIKFFLLISLLVSSVFSTSCSRKSNPSTTLKFNLANLSKNQSAQSEKKLKFVAINISGPNMTRLLCKYDTDNNNNNALGVWKGNCFGNPANPLDVTVNNVPTGTGRLIQVLAIIRTAGTDGSESEDFSYGEVFQNINPGDNFVSITTVTAPQSTNMEGMAAGRYLLPTGVAYTGKVALEYSPPTGRPNMEIMDIEMFNGWFYVHLLDNIKLTYRMRDNGHILFGGPIGQTSAVFNTNSVVKRITAPKTYNQYDNRSEQAEMMVFGFWKGTAIDSTGQVCHDSTSYTSGDMFLDAVFSNPLDWPNDYTLSGGSTCAVASPIVTTTKLYLDGHILEHGGSARLFHGPYMKQNINGHYETLSVSHDGTNLNLSWKYLPGVTSKGVAGSTVFYNTITPAGFEEGHDGGDGLDCSKLVASGFTKYDVTGSAESASLPGVPSTVMSTGKVIVCPRKTDGKYFSSVIESHGNGNSNCTNCGPTATKLNVSILGGAWNVINRDSCVPLFVQAQDDTNNPAEVNSMVQVNLNSGTIAGTFYDEGDSSCNGATVSSIYLEPFKNYKVIFFKPNNSGDTGLLTVSDNASVLTSGTYSVSNVTLNTTANLGAGTGAAVISSNNFYRHNCEPIYVFPLDINGNPVAPSSTNIYLDDNGAGGNFYYSYDDCHSNMSPYALLNLNISGGAQTMATAYYNNISGTGDTPLTLRANDGAVSTIYKTEAKTLKDPGPPTNTFTLVKPINNTDMQLRTGFCYPLEVILKDSMGHSTVSGSAFNVSVSVNPAEADLHDSSSCNGTIAHTKNFGFSSSTTYDFGSVYIMPLNQNVNITVNNDISLPSESFNIFADQTQMMITTGPSLAPSTCLQIDVILQDSTSSPLSTPHFTNKSSQFNAVNVVLSNFSSTPFLSSTASTCSPNNGISNTWGMFDTPTSGFFYLQTDGNGSTDIQLISPGIVGIPSSFNW